MGLVLEKVTLKAVGDWNQRLHIPLSNAMTATMEMFGLTGYQACEKAIAHMAHSASAATKQSAKLRPIVANPAFKGVGGSDMKRDKRRARFGVYRWNQKTGQKYFQPIYKGGEFGNKIKYISKDKVLVKVGNRWEEFEAGTGDFQIAGSKDSKRRIIASRGRAKQSWTWGLKGVKANLKIKDVTDITPIIARETCGLVLTNRLRYIRSVTPSGLEEIVARKASNAIMQQVATKFEQRFATEIPRLCSR